LIETVSSAFVREVSILASLQDASNVVKLLGVCFGPGDVDFEDVWLVMQWVDGKDLRQLLNGTNVLSGTLPEEKALSILIGISMALEQAHSKRVGHLDLKPDNILLDSQGNVLLADFGIARTASAVSFTLTVQRALSAIPGAGTYYYMAPEQFRTHPDYGTSDTSERVTVVADVFALGAIAFELWTGRMLHQGRNAFAIAQLYSSRQTVGPLDDLIPAGLLALIERCLAQTPEQRPTAAEARAELQRLAQSGTAAAAGAEGMATGPVIRKLEQVRLTCFCYWTCIDIVFQRVRVLEKENVQLRSELALMRSDFDRHRAEVLERLSSKPEPVETPVDPQAEAAQVLSLTCLACPSDRDNRSTHRRPKHFR
jgi:serine/threonine-protein kinase